MTSSSQVTDMQTSFLQSLRIQIRVVGALLMREIITRYGRHNIGFAWLFGEPMLFTLGVTVLWNLYHNLDAARHINPIAYTITGYATILVWRNTIGRCTLAVQPNTALLYHRNVRVLDLFWSRIILELSGATLSMVTLLGVFIAFEAIPMPTDITYMALGWFLLMWYSAAMALLVGGLSEFSELVERLWHPIAYFQLPVSGALVMAEWLPENYRRIVLLFPAANCVEIFRFGYFGSAVIPIYSLSYVFEVNLVLSWLGLLVVNKASARVQPE